MGGWWLFLDILEPLSKRRWSLWTSRTLERGAVVRWDVIAAHCGPPILTMVALLVLKGNLVYPAYEKAFKATLGKRTLDTSRELGVLGVANVIAAVAGTLGAAPQVGVSTRRRMIHPRDGRLVT